MLLSMTGFGNATHQTESAAVTVELKAVNNRYLKLSMRLPEYLGRFEPDIEKLVRQKISRGAVQLSFRIRLQAQATGYAIDQELLASYAKQLQQVDGVSGSAELKDLLSLPGVVSESEVTPDLVEAVWPVVMTALQESLEHFHEFRSREGESMQQDLADQCQLIATKVDEVEQHAPDVVADYRNRLLERINRALEETEATLDPNDVLREVALFTDKCDINEEITRLRSHLKQFDAFLTGPQSLGRKLEFLGQEMFREINTIGSKANNVKIAHAVVEMKAAIERIREILQNAE
ncbi:MAG: YicC family protein [Fuerstiella sp.]